METHNKFFVSLHKQDIVILRPPNLTASKTVMMGALSKSSIVLSRDDALLLAAWLVAMSDPDGTQFMRLLSSIGVSTDFTRFHT